MLRLLGKVYGYLHDLSLKKYGKLVGEYSSPMEYLASNVSLW